MSPTLKHLPLSHRTTLRNILFHSMEHNLFFQLKIPLGFPHISKYFQTKSNHKSRIRLTAMVLSDITQKCFYFQIKSNHKIQHKINCIGFIWHHPKVHLLLKTWIYSWAPDVSGLCSSWEEVLDECVAHKLLFLQLKCGVHAQPEVKHRFWMFSLIWEFISKQLTADCWWLFCSQYISSFLL